jgi:L-ribulose-5-phosphate 3-epimerase
MSFMWRAPAQEALEALARRGYRRFEIMASPPHFDPMMDRTQALAFARFLRGNGLEVETINVPSLDQNLASAVPSMRDYSVGIYERLIAVAETVEARGVITVTGRVNPLVQPARSQLEGWFAESFERVLRAAERAGIRLMLENIPMGVYPRADQLIAFADQFDSPCYDLANAHFMGEDAVAGVQQVGRKLDIVHLSDTNRDAWRHDPVGHGSCDFSAFGQVLRDINYAKTSMLEIVADPPVEPIVDSHRRLSAWGWEPLAPPP